MSASDDQKGMELFELAVDWYKNNGFVPFPSGDDDPNRIYHALQPSQFSVKSPTFTFKSSICSVGFRLIPALAAFHLEFSETNIGQLLEQYLADVSDIDSMYEDDDNAGDFILENEYGHQYDIYKLTIQLVSSLAITPSTAHELAYSNFKRGFIQSKMALAFSHTSLSQIYPDTLISDHANEIKRLSPRPSTAENHQYLPSRLKKISDLPNKNFMDFISRSGLINENLIKKTTMYFNSWEDIIVQNAAGHAMSNLLLKFCAKTSSPDRWKIRRAIESFSADTYEDSFKEDVVIAKLNKIFVGTDFEGITKSLIFQMNMIRTDDMEDALLYLQKSSHLFQGILKNQDTLLRRLCDELMGIDQTDMGYSQFTVCSKLKEMSLPPQQPMETAPEALIIHMLESLKEFAVPGSVSEDKQAVDKACSKGVSDLVTFLDAHYKLNPKHFRHLDQDQKLLLGLAGIDPRHLDLDLRSKGEILDERMGL